jgi:ABC-2 type transport system ATP-binding protein
LWTRKFERTEKLKSLTTSAGKTVWLDKVRIGTGTIVRKVKPQIVFLRKMEPQLAKIQMSKRESKLIPGRPNMYAIEVRDVGKVFTKWESAKKNGAGSNGKTEIKETIGSPANGNSHDGWLKRHLPHRKKDTALDGITFNVRSGEIFGLLGPNGSGKSTMIRILSTLLVPDAGEVRIFGKDVTNDLYEVQRLINRVSVDAAFYKKLSAHENLMYAARLYGVPAREIPVKAKEILGKIAFDLKRYHDSLEDFSRGMQQKVAIARALLTSPVVLLLDEPTTGLDPKSKREVQAFIEDVRDNHDATIVLTTHDMEEADRLCSTIGIIDKGKIIAMDTSEGLKSMVLKKMNGTAEGKDVTDITLEDVFLHLTGAVLKKEDDE